MQIEMKDPKTLLAYGNNARTHSDEQIDEIVESIKAFGFNDPIEIGADGVIISGHARAQAAVKAGLSLVPVVTLAGMNETARKAYILAANRIAQNAGWDASLLKIELGDLDADNFDLSLTGFTDDEIEKYLGIELLESIEKDDEEPKSGKVIECPECGHIF
jgi:ParB-like chromosome segregation protein Spo0J